MWTQFPRLLFAAAAAGPSACQTGSRPDRRHHGLLGKGRQLPGLIFRSVRDRRNPGQTVSSIGRHFSTNKVDEEFAIDYDPGSHAPPLRPHTRLHPQPFPPGISQYAIQYFPVRRLLPVPGNTANYREIPDCTAKNKTAHRPHPVRTLHCTPPMASLVAPSRAQRQ
jgi:hypothetical protein